MEVRFLYYNLYHRYIIYNCTRLCLVAREFVAKKSRIISCIRFELIQRRLRTGDRRLNMIAHLNIYNIDSRVDLGRT